MVRSTQIEGESIMHTSEMHELSASEMELVSGGWLKDLIEGVKLVAEATGHPPTMDEAREYLRQQAGR